MSKDPDVIVFVILIIQLCSSYKVSIDHSISKWTQRIQKASANTHVTMAMPLLTASAIGLNDNRVHASKSVTPPHGRAFFLSHYSAAQ